MGLRPDIRNYLTGDVYEIKPLSPYGVATAPTEAVLYAGELNLREAIYGPWFPGGTTFEPILELPYAGGPRGKVEAFSYPIIPLFGTVLYSDDLNRDLRDPALVVTAERLGYLAAKRLQQAAPALIGASLVAGTAVLVSQISFAPVTARFAF
jgi:hypothetical protein